MAESLGIDLGTTFCVAALVDERGGIKVLKNDNEKTLIPSVIYFGEDEIVVGEEAKQLQAMGEKNIASFFKRSVGDRYFKLEFNGKSYDAEDLSIIMLEKIKENAERTFGHKVKEVVITVPAYFNNEQREATVRAGKRAGFKVLRIINEPTAAAIAYGMRNLKSEKNLLVYDLGGGTFDVNLVKVTLNSIDVIGTDGDHELGGKDWDDRLALYVQEQFEKEFGVPILEDEEAYNELLVKCEDVKKQLSKRKIAQIIINYKGYKKLYKIDRTLFENITKDLMERTKSLTNKVIKNAKLTWRDIDDVLLVGGLSRMPMVKKYILNINGKEPIVGINVDEVVAIGAAIQASMDSSNNSNSSFTLPKVKKVQDVISHSLGMVAVNEDATKYINSIIINKNEKIPCTEKKAHQIITSNKEENLLEVYMLQGESKDPSECTMLGKYIFSDIEHISLKPSIIDIKYSYDRNGIVTVSAYQRETRKKLSLKIEKVEGNIEWLNKNPVKVKQKCYKDKAILIALDLSGSMSGEPLREAQKAAKKFVENMDFSCTYIGIIGFADRVKLIQKLSQNKQKLNKAIESLETVNVGIGTSRQPLSLGLEIFSHRKEQRFLIILTDGQWYGHNNANCIELANECYDKNIQIIAIGFGDANEKFLKDIASCRENALYTEMNNITKSFYRIAQVLTLKSRDIKIFK